MAPASSPTSSPPTTKLFAYLSDLMQRKRVQGLRDDMLSQLRTLADNGKLTEQELVDEATSMLEASPVNTGHQIGLLVWNLLRNREVCEQLVADPNLDSSRGHRSASPYPRTGVVSKIAMEDI